MPEEPSFYIYQDRGGSWRWSLVAANSKTVADSAEGYSSRQACVEAMNGVGRLINDNRLHLHNEVPPAYR
jgi:uncharacterized protein